MMKAVFPVVIDELQIKVGSNLGHLSLPKGP